MQLGEVIDGRFVVERFVARGGMGEVYRAIDQLTQKPVALKVMAVDDEVMAARFQLEARALLELDHPAIVRYVAHGATPDHGLYLAMEWLDGVTLSTWLRQHSLSLDQTLRLGGRVAEGLGAAHRRGMVHRDVKPGNLFLAGRRVEWAKVLDFGLVRNPLQQITATGAGMGTPEYMSPEQARGERTVGPAADVFALGCVLYRCITGRRAFEGDQVKVLLARLATFEAPPRIRDVRPDVPPAIDELIADMMAQDAAARPADGAAVAERIRQAREGLTADDARATPADPSSLTTSEQLPVAVLFVDLDRVRQKPPSRPPPISGTESTLNGTVFFMPPAGAPPASATPARGVTPPRGAAPVRGVTPARGAAAAAAAAAVTAPPDVSGATPAALAIARADDDPVAAQIRDTALRTGGKVVPLANGALVVTLSGGAAAPELAVRAARCALAIQAIAPTVVMSLAMRQIVVDERRALSPLVDGAAAMPRSRGIRIDARTRELLPDRFEVVGDDDGGYRLVGERAAELAPRRLLGREMPCVGRASILRQLLAVIDGVVEDRAARAVVVVGEPGVGKSRVRGELMAALRAKEVGVIQAGGDPLRAGVPGGAIARAVRDAMGASDDAAAALRARVAAVVPAAQAERVAEFLAELIGLPGAGEPSPAVRAARQDPRFMAEQQRRAVEEWLAGECVARPTALVVDDLQWADALSVELIEAALRRARDLPLFVLAFARPEVQQRFPKLDVAWGRDEIRLEPLRPAASEQLVREALGEAATPSLVARLVEHAGGNPFYLEELIRTAASAEPASLPGSVLASLQLRIGARPQRARLVLRAASVFGRVFWGGAVAALLAGEMDRAELDEWLEVLERDELIERRGPSRAFAGELEYAFRHDLLRDASYQMLTPEDRMAGHRLAGGWLVAHGEADAVVLAEHFAGGGATAQAVTWFQRAAELALAGGADDVAATRKAAAHFRRAGETCAAAYANDAAIGHLERAVALWAAIDRAEAARTRLTLAKVREVAGDPDAALAELRAAELDAIAAAAPASLRVEILLARAYVEGRSRAEGALDRSLETAEAALTLARSSGSRDLEVRAMTSLAGMLARTERPAAIDRSVELAQRAVALADDRGPLGMALFRLGNAFLAGNRLDAAARVYDDALAAVEASRDEALVGLCNANMGLLAFRRWHLDEAIEREQRALEKYERIGYQTRILEATLNLGMFLHLRGETQRGKELLGNVLGQARGDWVLTSLAQETLADIERLQGREVRAQARLRAAARVCEKAGTRGKQALYLGMLAESLWAAGEAGAALVALEESAEAGQSLTLSHAFVLLQLGQLGDAIEWIPRFIEGETDPQRQVLARVALARGLGWIGSTSSALAECDRALATLSPSPVDRFALPVRCLRHALRNEHAEAVSALERAQSACAPYEHAEAALDVGEALVRTEPDPSTVTRFLAVSRDVAHHGIRYRVDDLRSELFATVKDYAHARDAVMRANAELDRQLARMTEPYREQMLDHAWVKALRRVRAVP